MTLSADISISFKKNTMLFQIEYSCLNSTDSLTAASTAFLPTHSGARLPPHTHQNPSSRTSKHPHLPTSLTTEPERHALNDTQSKINIPPTLPIPALAVVSQTLKTSTSLPDHHPSSAPAMPPSQSSRTTSPLVPPTFANSPLHKTTTLSTLHPPHPHPPQYPLPTRSKTLHTRGGHHQSPLFTLYDPASAPRLLNRSWHWRRNSTEEIVTTTTGGRRWRRKKRMVVCRIALVVAAAAAVVVVCTGWVVVEVGKGWRKGTRG